MYSVGIKSHNLMIKYKTCNLFFISVVNFTNALNKYFSRYSASFFSYIFDTSIETMVLHVMVITQHYQFRIGSY